MPYQPYQRIDFLTDPSQVLEGVIADERGAPQLRYTVTGIPVLGFKVVHTSAKADKVRRVYTPVQTYYEVSFWEEQALQLAEQLQPGQRVRISGVIFLRTWKSNSGDGEGRVLSIASPHFDAEFYLQANGLGGTRDSDDELAAPTYSAAAPLPAFVAQPVSAASDDDDLF